MISLEVLPSIERSRKEVVEATSASKGSGIKLCISPVSWQRYAGRRFSGEKIVNISEDSRGLPDLSTATIRGWRGEMHDVVTVGR